MDDVTVLGLVGCVAPSYLIVIVDNAAKPVPDTVIVVPPMPLVMLRLIDGIVVKLVCAVCCPSVAVMVCEPVMELGTVNVAENSPEGPLVAVVTVLLSKVMLMLADGIKLVPVTVIERPTTPDVGFRAIEGIWIVSEAEPVWLPVATVPVTVREKVPPGVEPEVRIVREVLVELAGLVGKEIGLAKFTVLLPGAPVNDRRIVLGSPVVVEPGSSETLTV